MPTARPSATARAALVQSGSATEDFEAGMADWQNWGNSQVVSGAGTSGSNALQVGAGAGGAGLQVPGLVAGTTYRLTAQVRATDPMGGPTTMGVDFYDASGARVLTTYTPHVTSTSFAPLTFQVEAPAGTSYALVWIWKDGTSGFAYLDDFAFAADSLSNSGFEAGMTDWVDWGNTSVVSGQANSGSFALSVGTAAGGAGHYVDGIVAGTTYRLSASAKVSDASETVFVGVNMLDAAGEQVGTTQLHLSTTSTSYVTLSGDTTAPPGAVRAQVYVWKNAGSGLGYVDDFAFVAASKSSAGFPFGSRKDGAYPFGTLPSQVSANTAAADANIIAHFQALYDNHFKSSLNAIPGGMGPLDAHGAIVSEGIGYWMLLAVTMQGVDMGTDVHGTPRLSPKQIFDGCLATALARPADQLAADNPGDSRDPLTKHLMTWRITGDGDWVPDNNGDKYSAPDGDMDIALALLMAHRQWGSTGTYDYAYLAAQRIAAIKAWHMHSDGTLIAMSKPAGFGVYPSDPAFSLVRTSDFMFNHFRAFARATNDGFWLATNESDPSAFTRAKWLANYIQSNSTSGLLPDFIEGTETSTPYLPKDKLYHGDPSMIVQVVDNAPTGNYGAEDVYDTRAKYFDSNASRNIWRYVTEYVFSGDPGVKTILDKHVTFFKNLMVANGNDPTVIQDSYRLDGTPTQYAQQGEFAEVLGSVMAGMCLEGYATQCDPLWSWNTGASGSGGRNDPGYYAGEIQLMSKLVASGNWWQP